MKTLARLIVLGFLVVTLFSGAYSQGAKRISAEEYEWVIEQAMSDANRAFPFVYSRNTDESDNNKIIISFIGIKEQQSAGFSRTTQTYIRHGNKTMSYELKAGFGNNYCGNDGISWYGPKESGCFLRDFRFGGIFMTATHTVEMKKDGEQTLKIYRRYAVSDSADEGKKKEFEETVAAIDSRGLLISLIYTTGTLEPRSVTLVKKEIWDRKTKFPPIVTPAVK